MSQTNFSDISHSKSEESILYDSSYAEWKRWSQLFVCDDYNARYFKGELSNIELSGKKIFEIGFGQGRFLAWAKQQDAKVAGCELILEMIHRGRMLGYDVRLGGAESVINPNLEKYDIVVAFDVFEHIASDELPALLKFICSVLVPNGLLLARVPNGQSPFGRIYQHGDITHINTLSKGKFEQLAAMCGYEVIRISNAYRVEPPGLRGLRQRLRFRMRDVIERFICDVYNFGRLPFDQNIVAVLRAT